MDRLDHLWPVRLGAILWFVALLAFLLSAPVLLQAWPPILLVVVVAAGLFAWPIAWVWRRLRRKGSLRSAWAKTAVGIAILASVVLAAPVYFFALLTDLQPALVAQVTMTNGAKTVVFQGMQHVGTDRFYRSVVYDLENALGEGQVLFYEGVTPSTSDADRWFNQVVTDGHDLTASYRELGEVCGLQFQNDYLATVVRDRAVHPDQHVVADVSTTDLKREYERLIQVDPRFGADMKRRDQPEASTSQLEGVVSFLQQGTAGQNELAGVICRGFMTMVMNKDNDPSKYDDLDPLILDYRNRVLADRILTEPREAIYVTYGAKHMTGVYDLLRRADSNWRVVSVKWLRTIESPDTQTGTLHGMV